MKKRTIEELHDKYIGHKKFAKICDLIIAQDHEVTDIREYNEKFKFEVDGYKFEYSKQWKSPAKNYVTYFLNLLEAKKHLEDCWKH